MGYRHEQQTSLPNVVLVFGRQTVSSETIAAILSELKRDLNDLTAAHTLASAGLIRIREFFTQLPTLPQNPDPLIMIGTGDPNTPEARQYAQWRRSEAIEQTQLKGSAETRLGQQWIVFLYALWEHEYRPRLAVAHNRDPNDERYPLIGDLRLIRNDVIHHRGVATSTNTGRCKVLQWFQPGETIILRGQHFEEFIRIFPWSDLASGT
jgi:hypothetical protein